MWYNIYVTGSVELVYQIELVPAGFKWWTNIGHHKLFLNASHIQHKENNKWILQNSNIN